MRADTLYRFANGTEKPYVELLDEVQEYITANFADEVAEYADRQNGEQLLTGHIIRYLIDQNIVACDGIPQSESARRLFQDMAGFSFLSEYIDNPDEYPTLEELNINSWNSIWAHFTGSKRILLDESFLSPQHAIDVVKRIASMHSVTVDASTPGQTTYISENIRMTVTMDPIMPKNIAAAASIRFIRPGKITEQSLINTGAITEEMLEFLNTCIKHSVSGMIGGRMGSGKTTLLNILLSRIPDEKRVIAFEEGSREIDLYRYDRTGRLTNQFLSMLTRPSKDPEQNYDTVRLLQLGVRYDADYFVPQEMRSGESFQAQESARTGTAVWSTIHSNSADNTHSRAASLMQIYRPNIPFDTLMGLTVEAFPLAIYMRPLADEVRRVMEVFEAERYVPGRGVVGRTIYRYTVDDNIEKPDGSTVVVGHFEKARGISPRLQRILLDNGAEKKKVMDYAQETGGTK